MICPAWPKMPGLSSQHETSLTVNVPVNMTQVFWSRTFFHLPCWVLVSRSPQEAETLKGGLFLQLLEHHPSPLPHMNIWKTVRAKPKHTTYYLIFHEMSSHLPQEWNRCPLTIPEGEGSKGLSLLEWSAEAYFTFVLLAKVKPPA